MYFASKLPFKKQNGAIYAVGNETFTAHLLRDIPGRMSSLRKRQYYFN